MSTTVSEWAIHQEEAVYASHRSQVDAAKILVGLTLAVAATLVGTALQVDPVTGWDTSACWMLGISVILSVCTVGFDHVQPYPRTKLEEKRVDQLEAAALSAYIHEAMSIQRGLNERSVAYVRACSYFQVLAATVTGVLSVVSLIV